MITQTTKNWIKTPLVLWTVISVIAMLAGGYFLAIPRLASAAALTSVQDVLSASAPATLSDHTIQFVTPSGVANNSDFTLTFEAGFDLATDGPIDFNDIDLNTYDSDCTSNVSARTLAATAGADIWGATLSSQVITFDAPTSGTAQIDAGDCVEILIGENATGGASNAQIENPTKAAGAGTADIRSITIGGDFGDSGVAYVAIIEGVTVSVTVEESLSFSIAGVAAGSCTGDTGTPAPVAITTTATTVPFGTIIDTDRFYVGCQLLTLSTNAVDGYQVTAETDTSLRNDGADDNIDSGACDGTCTQSTGDTWATPSNNGFAYFCEEGTNTPCDDAGDATSEYRNFACTGSDNNCDPRTGGEAPVVVMTEAGTASSSTATVHYKLSIDPTQTTGLTYDTIVTYIATGTF